MTKYVFVLLTCPLWIPIMLICMLIYIGASAAEIALAMMFD